MATESDLRDLLQHPDPEGRGAIDVDAVLSRARRRRRPRVIAAQALGSAAVVGALFTAVFVTLPQPAQEAATIAQDTAGGSEYESQPFADEDALKTRPACGAAVDDLVTSDGPTAVVEPIAADVGSDALLVSVALRNDGQFDLIGMSSRPSLLVTQDGVVVALALAVTEEGYLVDLAPGESLAYSVEFTPVACDTNEPLTPGSYDLRATIDVSPEDGEAGSLVVTGPPSVLEIG